MSSTRNPKRLRLVTAGVASVLALVAVMAPARAALADPSAGPDLSVTPYPPATRGVFPRGYGNWTTPFDGGPISWHLDVTNTGTATSAGDSSLEFDWDQPMQPATTGRLVDMVVTGTHASDCTLDAVRSVAHCALGPIAPGASTVVTFSATADAEGAPPSPRPGVEAAVGGWEAIVSDTGDTVPGDDTDYSSWSVLPFAPATPTAGVSRIGGADRYDTSVELARSAYPSTAPVVFLATGTDFPDALSAGPAAAVEGGPLLLTPPGGLTDEVASELASLHPARVVIVGGTSAVSPEVDADVRAVLPDATVSRIAGADRYATSLAIATAAFPKVASAGAWIATGGDYPDALSAAAAAGAAKEPVVLVPGATSAVSASTLDAVTGLGVTHVQIAGGVAAVGNGVEASFERSLGVDDVVRWAGADRYITSEEVAVAGFVPASRTVGESPLPSAYLAAGVTFPDALAGSAVAAAQGAPLVITPADCMSPWAMQALDSFPIGHVTLIGGTSALASSVESMQRCS